MATLLNPYLSFPGTARQAMEFYRDVFGGELTLSTFGEYAPPDTPGADGIMHGRLSAPGGLELMGADTPPGEEHKPGNDVSLSLSGEDAETLRAWFQRLADGGSVTVPLEVQMWGDEFGMCTDRFGVRWMVNIAGQAAGQSAGPSS